ncbi:MAG: hypothetical protein AVDCRST_MAG28-430 [uncultured Rubrobacteraceae bacterium]|uniref:Uncharacterized protein n=1 Tax=uncultured Rubrobacteraceae bacterium TaxID=349277 RepID=A0A6J4QGM4_9ACTN|nr:MAG: hypothetical protein AVDCRST_MAG28-430 [uncultured Rubrobacteraceae bacterium]
MAGDTLTLGIDRRIYNGVRHASDAVVDRDCPGGGDYTVSDSRSG